MWIWESPDWPALTWSRDNIRQMLPDIYRKQGMLTAMQGRQDQAQSSLEAIVENIVQSSAIEGENLDRNSVKSSLAERLGLEFDAPRKPLDSKSKGVVDLMMDALGNTEAPLTADRLYKWHRWLFPEDEYRIEKIDVGQWRKTGTMQVVSGRPDHRPTVHFEAPPVARVPDEMNRFIDWFNESRTDNSIDPVERAALAHLWFVTIHPFDDGNGRIARAIGDMALAQADPISARLYEMSSIIRKDRKGYYDVLEATQKGDLSIDRWVNWFSSTLSQSLDTAIGKIETTLDKTRFWDANRDKYLLPPQTKALNKLLDGHFPEGLTARHYGAFAKVSKATATRHLGDLVEKGCIEPLNAGGRSTRYRAVLPDKLSPGLMKVGDGRAETFRLPETGDQKQQQQLQAAANQRDSSDLQEVLAANRKAIATIKEEGEAVAPSRRIERRELEAGLRLIAETLKARGVATTRTRPKVAGQKMETRPHPRTGQKR
tara:strand:+ start:10956 stop:12413 length:1458 start_codon:yes stop_codon:yes gene_type:complete